MYVVLYRMDYQNHDKLKAILSYNGLQNLQSLMIGYLICVFQILVERGYFSHILNIMIFHDKQKFEQKQNIQLKIYGKAILAYILLIFLYVWNYIEWHELEFMQLQKYLDTCPIQDMKLATYHPGQNLFGYLGYLEFRKAVILKSLIPMAFVFVCGYFNVKYSYNNDYYIELGIRKTLIKVIMNVLFIVQPVLLIKTTFIETELHRLVVNVLDDHERIADYKVVCWALLNFIFALLYILFETYAYSQFGVTMVKGDMQFVQYRKSEEQVSNNKDDKKTKPSNN